MYFSVLTHFRYSRARAICPSGIAFAAAFFLVIVLAGHPAVAQESTTGSARLKDLVVLEGASPTQLTGYGLVVGLDRTGDRARGRRSAPYTVQSIGNMLRRYGIAVDPKLLGSRNAAAVMVTARMNPFTGPGSQIDVTVSSLGDARSLSGGVLLQTPLLSPPGQTIYAVAQGPLTTGSAAASSRGSSVQINHPNTGRIPNGGIVQASLPINMQDGSVGLVLERPDFTNAGNIAEAINNVFSGAATAQHAGLVQVDIPSEINNGPAGLMAALEGIEVEVDQPARVVVNERTGTIVAGGEIRISEVMVTYGSLTISTQEEPFVSQPAPLSENGQTVTGATGSVSAEQQQAQSVVLPPNTNVSDLASALNELGLTARDVISIFQSIDQAGALQGDLVIL